VIYLQILLVSLGKVGERFDRLKAFRLPQKEIRLSAETKFTGRERT